MLDIANTRKVRQVDLIRELEPALAHSASMATTTMEAEDAWRYLGALIQKLEGLSPSMSVTKSIRTAAVDLASRHPLETVEVLSSLNVEPQRELLVSAAADGLARSLNHDVAELLSRLDGDDLLDLLFASASLAEGTIGRFPIFASALAAALRTADVGVRAKARRRLLGLLVDDRHVEPARLLIGDLDTNGLIKEAAHVHAVNGLSSSEIRSVLVERARTLQADAALRDAVSVMGRERRRRCPRRGDPAADAGGSQLAARDKGAEAGPADRADPLAAGGRAPPAAAEHAGRPEYAGQDRRLVERGGRSGR